MIMVVFVKIAIVKNMNMTNDLIKDFFESLYNNNYYNNNNNDNKRKNK